MQALRCIAIAGLLAVSLGSAHAQDWPKRPLTMVIPFAAGSATDAIGRTFAKRISELLGAQVIVENVGGAGGMTGAHRVARAAPDGYQFVLGTGSTHAASQLMARKPLYDATKDFAPVALVAQQPVALVARKDLPVASLRDFFAYAKVNHAKLQFGSGGVGSLTHLACVLLNSNIGVDITHVPYKAAIQAVQEMIAGRIDYACPNAAVVIPLIQGGQIRPIAMLSNERSPMLPELATAREQGLEGLDSDNWIAFFLPKGTPAPIAQKLHAAAVDAANTLALQERLRGMGASVVASERRSPEYLASFVKSEIKKWTAVIKAAGISTE